MSIIQKMYDFLLGDDNEKGKISIDGFEEKKLPTESEYKISPYEAFQIASRNENLKTNYFRSSDKFISYLHFTDCDYELVDGDNGKKYWLIKITNGDVSSIYTDEELNTTFTDGTFGKDDLKKLQCLIDVEKGDYIYFTTEE